jgi:NAD(P)-dependent dehydrogenase (short-subunit alcohol dehydrogenase family)
VAAVSIDIRLKPPLERSDEMQLAGKVAVVTGAAQGNGRAIAERLAAEGAQVVLGDVKDAALEAVAHGVSKAGGSALALHCDVSQADDVDALIAAAERLGGPHAVVAQAGGRFGAMIEDTTPEMWDRVMAVDLRGTFLTVRAALPRMRKLGGGSIVTMSGTYAYSAEPGVCADCAAKGAILAFTRAVAVEGGPHAIRCNTIVPGYIGTPMVADYFATVPSAEVAAVAKRHALQRIGRPDEIAAAALFLCSDESSFCTGQAIIVDGGLIAGTNAEEMELGQDNRLRD